MVVVGLVLFGAALFVVAVVTFLRADADFAASLSLRGIDPNHIEGRDRERGVRRNRLASAVMAVIGLAFVAWGVI